MVFGGPAKISQEIAEGLRHRVTPFHAPESVLGWEREFAVRCEVLNVGGGIGVNHAELNAQVGWTAFTRGLAPLVDTFPAHWRRSTSSAAAS